jgi:prepilin-type N-terminal cleavage/methylation domain-containing protein
MKSWQLCLWGVIAGAMFAGGRILMQENEQIGGEGFVDRASFERMLRRRNQFGWPCIQSIEVSRRGNIDLVTFDAFDVGKRTYEERRLAAPRPYTPPGGRAAFGSVQDYLQTLRPSAPELSVRHAWWNEPGPMLVMWTVAGALAGGVWPLVRWFFVRPPPRPALEQHRTSAPTADPTSAQVTDTDLRHLEELEAEMVAGMNADTPDALQRPETPSPTGKDRAVVRTLDHEARAAQQTAPAENKEYAGEYYPVAKQGRHGFTLIEVLVSVGVVALLIAILLPTLSRAREQARQTRCASNLRQVGAGLELYNQTYHFLPLVATPVGVSSAMDDQKVVGIMTCPDDPVGTLSYAMNAAYVGLPKSQGNPSEALAFETGVGHEGRYYTVYFDGHVDDQPRGTP